MTCAIILAGGLGTRLRPLVPDLPKPMAPVNGRPFLEHQMDYWIGQGVRRYVLSVGYRHEAIVDHFGRRYRGVPIGGFAALVDALGLTIEMSNGVLIARWLEGMKFTLGPTIGIRREVIEKVGGLEQFQQFCASDFEIGREVDLAGYEVRLSGHVSRPVYGRR